MTSRVISVAYGRAAPDALRTVVTEAKRDDLMAHVTVLVPDKPGESAATRAAALVVVYKTDAMAAGAVASPVEYYRPQVDAYARLSATPGVH